jgi:hypothetical protein
MSENVQRENRNRGKSASPCLVRGAVNSTGHMLAALVVLQLAKKKLRNGCRTRLGPLLSTRSKVLIISLARSEIHLIFPENSLIASIAV